MRQEFLDPLIQMKLVVHTTEDNNMQRVTNMGKGLIIEEVWDEDFTQEDIADITQFSDEISGIDDYDYIVEFEQKKLQPERDALMQFSENKVIYEDLKKPESKLKQSLKEAGLNRLIEEFAVNDNGDFLNSSIQRQACEKFKQNLMEEGRNNCQVRSIWSSIKEKAKHFFENSPLKIFRIFRNKEKELEQKKQELLKKEQTNAELEIGEIKKMMNGWTKTEKQNGISQIKQQCNDQILFDYLKQHRVQEKLFCMKSLETADIKNQESIRQCLDVLNQIEKYDSLPKGNKEFLVGLSFFNGEINKSAWHKSRTPDVEAWMDGPEGCGKTVYAKCLCAKLDVYNRQISQSQKREEVWDR